LTVKKSDIIFTVNFLSTQCDNPLVKFQRTTSITKNDYSD